MADPAAFAPAAPACAGPNGVGSGDHDPMTAQPQPLDYSFTAPIEKDGAYRHFRHGARLR